MSSQSPVIVRQMLSNAPQVFTSHPTSIFFFFFNHKNKLAHQLESRKSFAKVISEVRANVHNLTPADSRKESEEQLIPFGFSGRVPSLNLNPNVETISLPKKINICLWPYLKDYDLLLQNIKDSFSKYQVTVQFKFQDKIDFNSDDDFAALYSFIGNQQDSSGSWAFLVSPHNGLLKEWTSSYLSSFETAFSEPKNDLRQSDFIKLHQQLLENYISVPLMVGSTRYLLNKNLDVSSWNTMDARMRLYEIREK
jgi:hypothetical protein